MPRSRREPKSPARIAAPAAQPKNMSHQFEYCYWHCIDSRLQKAIHEEWLKRNLYGRTDRISWPGTIMDLVSPKNPSDREHMLWPFEVAYNKHGIRHFILTQHMDCGAYGSREAFGNNEDKEFQRHKSDLDKAEQLLLERFPDITIEKEIIRMQGDEVVDFISV